MIPTLKQYAILVEFLGQALGSDYEVVLHDLTEGRSAVAAIANGQISGRSPGAPLTNKALRFLAERDYETRDYNVRYRGAAPSGAQLSSSTMFIKDEEGRLIGMLCINHDQSRGLHAANEVLALCGLPPLSPAPDSQPQAGGATENLVGSIPDLVRDAIASATGHISLPAERLTMTEKIQVVDALNQGGLFYLKGAVSEVAAQLGSSEATIYRYLSKVKG